MKKIFVLIGLMMLVATAASAATLPTPVVTFMDTIMAIVVEKGILIAGVGIIIVGGILGFTNKSWSPFVYAIIGVILMVIAKPFIVGMISWGANASF